MRNGEMEDLLLLPITSELYTHPMRRVPTLQHQTTTYIKEDYKPAYHIMVIVLCEVQFDLKSNT